MSPPRTSPDPELSAALVAVDSAFAHSPRPEKFADHPYCKECAEADEYFHQLTPVSIADVTDPPETLPLSFLTDRGFSYLLPGILRWLPRTGPQYCVGDVPFHVETRLGTLNAEPRAAIRDVLHRVRPLEVRDRIDTPRLSHDLAHS